MGELLDFSKNDGLGGTRTLIPDQIYTCLTLTGNYSIRIRGILNGNEFIGDKQFNIVEDLVTEGEYLGESQD